VAHPLASLVDPAHTALVTQECQNGIIGTASALPVLASAARGSMLPAVVRLVAAAHRHDVQVVHCLAARRADGRGSNTNARLFMGVRRAPVQLLPGSHEAALVDEIERHDSDLVSTRLHGLGPMAGTDLDALLRNLGVTTIVGVGVSVNVAILNFAMDAVNLGYQFVLPRDAVAGVPEDYAESVIDHTLSLITTVTDVDAVIEAWAET
jgi:nicotinamidase-related amidase